VSNDKNDFVAAAMKPGSEVSVFRNPYGASYARSIPEAVTLRAAAKELGIEMPRRYVKGHIASPFMCVESVAPPASVVPFSPFFSDSGL